VAADLHGGLEACVFLDTGIDTIEHRSMVADNSDIDLIARGEHCLDVQKKST